MPSSESGVDSKSNTISAAKTTGNVLDSHLVTSVGTYEFVQFSVIGSIAALTFSADSVNVAYWDNLTVTTIVVPAGENIEIDPGFITAVAAKVIQAGTIDFEFCVAVVDHWVGKWFIPLSRYSFTGTCLELPHDVFLPPGFKPFMATDGLRKLGIVTGDSTVLFEGLIIESQDRNRVLGFDPGCATDLPVSLGVSDLDVANRILKLQTGECNFPRSARSSYSTTVFPLHFTGNGKVLALARVAKIKAELRQAIRDK